MDFSKTDVLNALWHAVDAIDRDTLAYLETCPGLDDEDRKTMTTSADKAVQVLGEMVNHYVENVL